MWWLAVPALIGGAGYIFDKYVMKDQEWAKGPGHSDKKKKEDDKPKDWWDWFEWWYLTIPPILIGIGYGVYWFFFKKRIDTKALFHIGYNGLTPPTEFALHSSYLAGVSKRNKDAQLNDLANRQVSSLVGLKAESATVEFGKAKPFFNFKKRGYNENY